MSKKGKYEVQKFTCIPVEPDAKGKYQRPGQLMMTENNLIAVIIAAEPLAFKDRHSETPLQRFLTTFVDDDVLQAGLAKLNQK